MLVAAAVVIALMLTASILVLRPVERMPHPQAHETTPPSRAPATTPAGPVPPREAWQLVWSDEFESTELDTEKWTALDVSTFGDGNGELACLTARDTNLELADGELRLTADREDPPLDCGAGDSRFPGGRDYSSAFIETRGKASFEYGRFEISARTPTPLGRSQGIWPAFWLRPDTEGPGELDVMEIAGTDAADLPATATVSQALHFDYKGTYPAEGNTVELAAGDYSDAFHTYAVEWSPGRIRWFVDDDEVYERTTATTPWLDEAFSGDFYLRLNLAVGGDWLGAPSGSTSFPATFAVEYVRVYQR